MNLDADALKHFRLADTGEFQKLGRIDRTGADDHFPVGACFVLPSVHIVAHPDAALAFEQQTFSQRIGLDGQVWPPSRRIQIADGGAHPTTTADHRLGHANPILSRAVIVLGIRDADLAGRLDQRVVDRSALVAFADLQRPAAAAILVVGVALVAFHVAENRQYVSVAPAAIAELRPGIVVLRLATDEDHAVIEDEPPRSLPRGIGMRRSPVPSSGSDEYSQLAAGFSISFAKPTGIRDQGWLSLPASSTNTLCLRSALSRFASTDPADPAPT